MDHTPGQRQWSNLAKYRLFHRDKKWTDQEFEADLASRREAQEAFAQTNRKEIVAICRDRGLPMASHDDTLPEHVAEAVGEGISISEFPTTETAARNARRAGMRIVMGAPNLVRGDSHSGNVSALVLGRKGLLDGLSSDYVPASLLHGAFLATERLGWPLPEAVATVSANIADFLGLADRGRIAPGRRADLIRVTLSDGLPVVRSVWREGRRVC
jgi:alpha-D-ribose 1-methylphosphonate 5-triphosphate diphosphatase